MEEAVVAPAATKPKAVPAVRYKGTGWSVVVPGAYTRMSTEKPRRIYAQKAGLECEPNCRDLQSKRTDETPLVVEPGRYCPARHRHAFRTLVY